MIKFGYVGKESKSDTLARKTASKKRKPDYVARKEEVLKYLETKKSGSI